MPGEHDHDHHDHDHHDHDKAHAHDHHDHEHGHDHAHDHTHDHAHAPPAAPAAPAVPVAAAGGGHGHGHDHGGHGHHHHHHGPAERRGLKTRFAIAGCFVLVALLGATGFMVRAGTAMVVTRFGEPVNVIVQPGLGWKWPAPVERTIEVDCRLQSTASGSHGVLTKDGLSVVVQAAATWRVPAQERNIVQFLRAVRNQPAVAANQLRTFLGSSLETVTSRFELASLVNIDAAKVRLPEFEAALKERLEKQVLEAYGVEIVKVGIVRLMLPESTVPATTNRMSAERDTVAEERKAYGRKAAGEIRSGAEKDARIVRAKAEEEASAIVAEARKQAAAIYGRVQALDPQLYAFLRSLDTLEAIINPGTRLVLRTDAAPFNALVEGPPIAAPAAKPDKPAAGTP